MKTYSLKDFLTKPINAIIENEDDYCFELKGNSFSVNNANENIIDAIKIPLIQRDYAQGRSSNEDLRNEFLRKIFDHLENNIELKLDFIYGSVNRDNQLFFLPLDGQQRLTTLYLIYWYLIKEEDNSEDNFSLLKKFSYETRDTSRRFFSNLVNFKFEGNPKVEIKKAYWFSDYFKLDPTIDSILNTLESIHKIYSESALKGSLLKNMDRIVFYVLPMEQFKLTDDLYIKLNARGKVLSSFENFKADLIGHIKNTNTFNKQIEFESNLSLPHYDVIANKFDNKWANLFWNKAKSDEGKKSIDKYFFRFIHRFLINDYIVKYQGSDLLKDEKYKSLLFREKELYFSNFEFYKDLISEETINSLETILDFYSDYNEEIIKNIYPLWNTNYQWDIFKSDNEGRFTMEERMLFDSVNYYILNSSDWNLIKFKNWIRVVWNIIIDPDIRSIGANKSAMTFIRNISIVSDNILEELSKGTLDNFIVDSKNIHSLQLKEEKEKSILLLSSEFNWQESIFEAESHQMLQGNLNVLLYDNNTPQDLNSKFETFKYLFSNSKPNEIIQNQHHILMRYVLASFSKWEYLEGFNFSSNILNWKTFLRRNNNVVKSIRVLLSKNRTDISDYITHLIENDSILETDNNSLKLVHTNLYKDSLFHNWMQDDGVNKIKWLSHHFFVIRPSAWYSKVMIDCYRNEIVTQLKTYFKINNLNNHRCSNSNYYSGENIEIEKIVNGNTISFFFDNYKNLIIGLKKELNLHLDSVEHVEENWIEKYVFDYTSVKNLSEINDFIESLKINILTNEKTLLKDLFD